MRKREDNISLVPKLQRLRMNFSLIRRIYLAFLFIKPKIINILKK